MGRQGRDQGGHGRIVVCNHRVWGLAGISQRLFWWPYLWGTWASSFWVGLGRGRTLTFQGWDPFLSLVFLVGLLPQPRWHPGTKEADPASALPSLPLLIRPRVLFRWRGNCLLPLSPQSFLHPLTPLCVLPPSLCWPAPASQPAASWLYVRSLFLRQKKTQTLGYRGSRNYRPAWSVLVPGYLKKVCALYRRDWGTENFPSKWL